ncbi:beta-ketoacyl synthase N-terminal-like domain-containing protein [Dactylosporangium sp. CA-233914]|uniref:thiolase family protein n=1 Tax=Dactylosporangium sp. CA-233914 TaxID=3239934 RepID=UPI003D8CC070
MTAAFLYAAARTPFGRFNGALSGVRPDDLAAQALTGLLAKAPALDTDEIGEVVWGCANQAGEDNRNVGRMAVLLAGLPVGLPATTVNRLCGSSLDAAMIASRTIDTGDADVVVAGGVESMTRAPWVLPKPELPYPAGNVTAVSTTLGWRLVNPGMPAEWTVSLGEANDAIAIGHPLGASGGRVLATLAAVLREKRARWGVAAICIGVGQALAVVLENVSS